MKYPDAQFFTGEQFPKKRKVSWFVGLLVLVILALSLWDFYPAIPSTPTARRWFHEMTGSDPSEVSYIYYYYPGESIRGGDAEYLRFTYPDDLWPQRFVDHLGLFRVPTSGGGPYTGDIPGWWDYSTISSLSECYGRTSEHTPNQIFLWLDRAHRIIYLYFGNPQRQSAGSASLVRS